MVVGRVKIKKYSQLKQMLDTSLPHAGSEQNGRQDPAWISRGPLYVSRCPLAT